MNFTPRNRDLVLDPLTAQPLPRSRFRGGPE